jgi:osmotically-inducible protein OsmY
LTALAGLLLVAPFVRAAEAEAEPKPAQATLDGARDLEIQVRARQQLLADEELAPFNLGVTVRNGVAVVWGPVPSPELKTKALKKIENVRGIYQVESEMYVSRNAGLWLNPSGISRLPDVPEQTSSAMPDLRTGQLPVFPGQLASKKISEPPGPPKLVQLMPPVPVADESGDLAAVIERLRKGDERYRLIQVDVKNGAIYLRGSAKPENVMAFARALSNVPGVEQVVVQNQANR